MRRLLFMILGIVTVSILGAGGYILFNEAYTSGEASGYENGYYDGEESGYDWGNEEGYSNGFEEGYDTGEQDGYKTGYETGAAVGYDSGYTDGEEAGYIEGYSEGRSKGYDYGYENGYATGMSTGLGHGYTLKDPTYAEAVSFLRSDLTSENVYDETGYGIYVCSHFSRDTCNNAEDAGYRCALVELRYLTSGHSIIGFNTIDRGMVFFEPQTDEVVIPVTGKRFYQCVLPSPGTFYDEPEYDDTIMDILVIW
ncbi:MAG: hypothetical protein JW712_10860 [Dehalococcoidales bacterium]|nr:hypothetical protein [Dehalococcoidales bacterium]